MTVRVGINGYGRIGRNVLRALYEYGRTDDIQIVAINDLGDAEINVHLTRYDTAHGKFDAHVEVHGDDMTVNGDHIKVLSEPDPTHLPWGDLGVDVVMECTGKFAKREKGELHLQGGAQKVLFAQPAGTDVKTIVYGVNHHLLSADDHIVSNASCTTNCLAPLVKPLADAIGIEGGIMNTVHAYTNDQVLTDTYHKDLRRARSATQSMIPTKTGAAAAVGLVLPELAGKFEGFAVRVPTINVSMVDLSFLPSRETSVEEIHELLKNAAEGELKGVLSYCDEPLVSIDYNHNPHSSVYDATLTKVNAGGRLVKVCAWYDNEWGFSNRMLDTTLAWMAAD